MAREGSAARVVRNTMVNGLGSVAAIGISLVLTPFLIGGLGIEAYGVWTLALTFSFFGGYASLADFGVEGAAARFIAEGRGRGADDEVNRAASAAVAFFTGVAVVLTPVGVAIAVVAASAFQIPESLHHEAMLTFGLVAAQLLFELPARAFFAVMEGAQRFGSWQAIELMRALIQAALFIAVLGAGLGVHWLAVGLMISSLAVLGASGFAARRAIPELEISRKFVTRQGVKQLLSFGGGLLTIRMLGTIYRQMDKVILGAAAGPRFVAIFDIANKIHAGAATVQSVASSALLPATAFARESREVLRDMFLRGSSYTAAVAIPVSIATGVLAGPVIDKWVGDGLAGAVLPTQLFAAYLLFLGVHAVGSTMYVALGHLRPIILIVGTSVLANLGISLALVGPLGVEGVVLGTLISNVAAWPFLLALFLDRFDTSLGEWTRVVVVRNLPGVAVQAVLAWPVLALANLMPRLVLILPLFALYVVASLAAFLLLGLGGKDRAILLGTLSQAVGRSAPSKAPEPVPAGNAQRNLPT